MEWRVLEMGGNAVYSHKLTSKSTNGSIPHNTFLGRRDLSVTALPSSAYHHRFDTDTALQAKAGFK